jgi:hypothetical protein
VSSDYVNDDDFVVSPDVLLRHFVVAEAGSMTVAMVRGGGGG